jgi:uncharacterized protein (DUF433 family)
MVAGVMHHGTLFSSVVGSVKEDEAAASAREQDKVTDTPRKTARFLTGRRTAPLGCGDVTLTPRICGIGQSTVSYSPMNNAISSNAEIMGGTPCLTGTRVPFQTLLDYLEGGDSLDEFLEDFPSVVRELAVAALQQAGDLALAHARVA